MTPARRSNQPPLVFPSNPDPGELFGGLWQWDGNKWGAAGLAVRPPDAIDEVADNGIYGRSGGDWLPALPRTQVSWGTNHLQIGNILFQWNYIPNYHAGVDSWIVMPRAFAGPSTVLLTSLVGGGGEASNIFVTVGIDHEEYSATQWAYRSRYEFGGSVNVAGQGFFWLAVGVAA